MRNRSIVRPWTAALFLCTLLLAALPSLADSGCDQRTLIIPLSDPVSGRQYEIHVSLPDGFSSGTQRGWPLVVLADGGRAFPHLSCIARKLAREGAIGAEPVIVGLSYAAGESFEVSRRRDYTPTSGVVGYGGAAPYQAYIRNVVLPHVEAQFATDPRQRYFWGHSYGGLLGAHILFTQPEMFQTYMLGSPSFWFGDGAIYGFEKSFATQRRRLDARVLLYVGGEEIARYDPARRGNTRDMVAGMRQFEAHLRARRYPGLSITSAVIEGRDHMSAVRPGFEWALQSAMAAR
ncbi:alpha/beta hydrolase [Paracoccus versutus]|uniref:alpha/beta hydrolase n=1 Tax=Paracoccus versutus TaxID=34007 RepID=UPI0015F092D7|nr:alpha/beta hydrolase-fold protein [Paracoccus versutus]